MNIQLGEYAGLCMPITTFVRTTRRCFACMLMKVCTHQDCIPFAFAVETKSFTLLIMQTHEEGNTNFDCRHSGFAAVSGPSLLII